MLRKHLCEGSDIPELENSLPSLKHAGVVGHTFWQSCCATGQVASTLQGYKVLSGMVCDMVVFVKELSKKKEPDVLAADVKKWCDLLPKQLNEWVGSDLANCVEKKFLTVCHAKKEALAAAGLNAVAKIVDQCCAGKVPPLPTEAQQQMLLKIPSAKGMKHLVRAFLEAPYLGKTKLATIPFLFQVISIKILGPGDLFEMIEPFFN